jgi:phage tail protein X
MTTSYRTIQNDRLDRICRSNYGSERGGTVESVLAVNPGLALKGPLYEMGLVILLPDLPEPQLRTIGISLWD